MPSLLNEGAAWLALHWDDAERPYTTALRERFGLGFNDACKAIAEARRIVPEKKR